MKRRIAMIVQVTSLLGVAGLVGWRELSAQFPPNCESPYEDPFLNSDCTTCENDTPLSSISCEPPPGGFHINWYCQLVENPPGMYFWCYSDNLAPCNGKKVEHVGIHCPISTAEITEVACPFTYTDLWNSGWAWVPIGDDNPCREDE
jgi:hypothetical protein